MQYRLEGKMDVVLPPNERGAEAKNGLFKEKGFCVEIEGVSEEDAKQRAIYMIKSKKAFDCPRNFQFAKIEIVSHDELGEIGKFIFESLKIKWLKENHHLEQMGFKPDTLMRPEEIPLAQAGGSSILRYINPETNRCQEYFQLDFPQQMTPLILKVANNKKEVEAAVDLIFNEVYIEEIMEGDGDHHSMTYGQNVIPAYYIQSEKAYILANSPGKLQQLIREVVSTTKKS